jgi:hypothetical protein
MYKHEPAKKEKSGAGLRHSHNSWVLNCAQKAKFIQKVYNDHPELPICWIDADGELIRKPFFFKNFNYDFAIKDKLIHLEKIATEILSIQK